MYLKVDEIQTEKSKKTSAGSHFCLSAEHWTEPLIQPAQF